MPKGVYKRSKSVVKQHITTTTDEIFVVEKGFIPLKTTGANMDLIQKFTRRLLGIKPLSETKNPKDNENLFIGVKDMSVTPTYFAIVVNKLVKQQNKKIEVTSHVVKDRVGNVIGSRFWIK